LKKVEPLILGLLLISSLVYSLRPTKIVNAQSTSSEPNWAIPGVAFSYGWQLWEDFPTSNLSSEILFMEQYFNIGSGNYTPERGWESESVFDFTLISADSQQGVFQISVRNQTVTWNYIWSNQTWQVNGQQDFLAIYVPPAQLSGNPIITIGSYRAYEVSALSSTNRTLYEYYQKDTGILLLDISVAIGPTVSDLIVMDLHQQAYKFPKPYLFNSSNNPFQ
jgi:hypothetical protein